MDTNSFINQVKSYRKSSLDKALQLNSFANGGPVKPYAEVSPQIDITPITNEGVTIYPMIKSTDIGANYNRGNLSVGAGLSMNTAGGRWQAGQYSGKLAPEVNVTPYLTGGLDIGNITVGSSWDFKHTPSVNLRYTKKFDVGGPVPPFVTDDLNVYKKRKQAEIDSAQAHRYTKEFNEYFPGNLIDEDRARYMENKYLTPTDDYSQKIFAQKPDGNSITPMTFNNPRVGKMIELDYSSKVSDKEGYHQLQRVKPFPAPVQKVIYHEKPKTFNYEVSRDVQYPNTDDAQIWRILIGRNEYNLSPNAADFEQYKDPRYRGIPQPVTESVRNAWNERFRMESYTKEMTEEEAAELEKQGYIVKKHDFGGPTENYFGPGGGVDKIKSIQKEQEEQAVKYMPLDTPFVFAENQPEGFLPVGYGEEGTRPMMIIDEPAVVTGKAGYGTKAYYDARPNQYNPYIPLRQQNKEAQANFVANNTTKAIGSVVPSINIDDYIPEKISHNLRALSNYFVRKFTPSNETGYIRDLSNSNVERITPDTKNVESILVNNFVEGNNPNTVRKAKDFKTTNDTKLGDRNVPLSNIRYFIGIIDGKMKLGSIDEFDNETVVMPVWNKTAPIDSLGINAQHDEKKYKKAYQDYYKKVKERDRKKLSALKDYFNPSMFERHSILTLSRKDPEKAKEIMGPIDAEYRPILDSLRTLRDKYYGDNAYYINGEKYTDLDIPYYGKSMLLSDNGNSMFLYNISKLNNEQVKQVNEFIQNNGNVYPILFDNGRYSDFELTLPSYERYTGSDFFRDPKTMFLIGETKKYANGGPTENYFGEVLPTVTIHPQDNTRVSHTPYITPVYDEDSHKYLTGRPYPLFSKELDWNDYIDNDFFFGINPNEANKHFTDSPKGAFLKAYEMNPNIDGLHGYIFEHMNDYDRFNDNNPKPMDLNLKNGKINKTLQGRTITEDLKNSIQSAAKKYNVDPYDILAHFFLEANDTIIDNNTYPNLHDTRYLQVKKQSPALGEFFIDPEEQDLAANMKILQKDGTYDQQKLMKKVSEELPKLKNIPVSESYADEIAWMIANGYRDFNPKQKGYRAPKGKINHSYLEMLDDAIPILKQTKLFD